MTTSGISDALLAQLLEENYGSMEWAAARLLTVAASQPPSGAQVAGFAGFLTGVAAEDPNWRPRA